MFLTSRCYGTSRSIKRERELSIYGTARPRGKFANENAMALLGKIRESWSSMAPLGHVEVQKRYATSKPIKTQMTVYGTSRSRGVNKSAKTFKKQKQKRKWKTKWKQKRKSIFIFIFVFVVAFIFVFVFLLFL